MNLNSALLDANVLFPTHLRTLFLNIAHLNDDDIQLYWTDEIDDEWSRNLILRNPNHQERILEMARSIKSNFKHRYVFGFEDIIPELSLPDIDDRHVLAAAIHADCSVLVTENLKDFPEAVLSHYNIKAISADDFLLRVYEQHPYSVEQALENYRQNFNNPPIEFLELLQKLESSVPRFVQKVRATFLELN